MKYSKTMLNKDAITKIVVRYKQVVGHPKYVEERSYLWGLIKQKPYIDTSLSCINVDLYFKEHKDKFLESGKIYNKPYCLIYFGSTCEYFYFESHELLDAFLDQFSINLIQID